MSPSSIPIRLRHRSALGKCFNSANSKAQRFASRIQGLQLAYRGAYSIERLHAFDKYCHATSRLRVFGVCLVMPLPALMVAIRMDCIPLQDPALGWRVNYGAFIRDGLMFFLTCFGMCVQARQLVSMLSLPLKRIVVISATTATCSVSLRMIMADTWAYPIPFGYSLGSAPHGAFMALWFAVVVGKKQFRKKPKLLRELWNQWIILLVFVALCLIYPAYNAVYLRLNSWQQTMFVFALPLLKLVLKNVLAWSTKHIVEFMPGVIAFSVEVFNALYISKCMQSADSITTFVAIMGFDALKAMITYRSMRTRARKIHELLVHCSSGGFVDTVLALCHDPGVLSREGSLIRIRSPITLARSETSTIRLDDLERRRLSARTTNHGEKRAAVRSVRLNSTREDNEIARRSNALPKLGANISNAVDVSKVKETIFRVEAAGVMQKPSIGFESGESKAISSTIAHRKNGRSRTVNRDLSSRTDAVRTSKISAIDHQTPATGAAVSDQSTNRDSIPARVNTCSATKPANSSIFQQSAVIYPWDLHRHENDSPQRQKRTPEDQTWASASVSGAWLLSSHEKHEIVDQSLRLLFQCEYHALVKYVEAAIALCYCVYVGVLSHLPSRKYYPEMRHMTTDEMENTIIHIIAYAGLEIVSFCVMHFLMKWRCGFSPLYLLAFVLEHQATEFLARLLIWFSFVLQFTLVHNGVDLSAKFAWLKGDWSGI